MINRRLIRIKVFKVLYSVEASGSDSLIEAEKTLMYSCEKTLHLYYFILNAAVALKNAAVARIDTGLKKFNPTSEERDPNRKFAENKVSGYLEQCPWFLKYCGDHGLMWTETLSPLVRKLLSAISAKDYYKEYMSSETRSLAEDCELFIRIFTDEELFEDNEALASYLEDMSLFWTDDLGYVLNSVVRSLETLRLRDRVERWGAAVLMNCRSLNTLRLTRAGAQGDALAYFADELPWELDAAIEDAAGGTVLRLIFPEYRENYEENCPAHHFDYTISGAGYPYHHSFRNKRLDLRTYDELWPGFLGMEHETESAVRLAFWRLRYPAELSPRAEERYLTYLRAHAGEAAAWLAGERDVSHLAFLLQAAPPEGAELSAACDLARRAGNTGALALLLEGRRGAAPRGLDKCFDL